MATNRSTRLVLLKEAISYLDAQDFKFVQKIVLIDRVCDDPITDDLILGFQKLGWTVLVENLKSKVLAFQKALGKINADFVYYNEDDIKAKLPAQEDLNCVFDWVLEPNRICGMVSMTLGGSTHDFPGKAGDLDCADQNAFLKKEDYWVFKRDEEKRSEYFFEFPGLFIRKEIFQACLKPEIQNHAIERDLTTNYFEQGLDKRFWKASVCKPNIVEVIRTAQTNYFREVLETAKLQRLLDPWQGGIYFDLTKVPDL